jgi:hypothetical protein
VAFLLAIEPAHARDTSPLPADLSGHELTRVATLDEALDVVARRIPDLIVFPVTLTAGEQANLSALARTPDAHHLDSLAIPLRAAIDPRQGQRDAAPRWFYWSRPTSGPLAAGRSEPAAFAEALRARVAPPVPAAPKAERVRRIASDAGRVGARTLRVASVHGARAVRLAGVGGARLAKHAAVYGARGARLAGRVGLRTARLSGAGAARAVQALREWPAAWSRSEERPAANRMTMPAETRMQLSRVRMRQYTAAAALVVVALPAGVMWRSEILTFASGLGVSVAEPAAAVAEPAVVDAGPPAGGLSITSNQEGATVIMGGKVRGTTPLVIDALAPGTYRVTVDSPAGAVTRSAVVKEGQTATLDAAIYPGWLALFAPIELEVRKGGRRLTLDDQNRVMLPPGPHDLELVNVTLGYRDRQAVNIEPGETTAVSVAAPRTTLSVVTTPPASLWIDGQLAGDTPVAGHPIDVGVHELVVRHSELGERRRMVTATTEPARVEIDLTLPQP